MITRKKILKAYVKHITKSARRPKSLKSFAKKLEVKEKHLSTHFKDFDAIEAAVYVHFMKKTDALLADEDFSNQHEALLALYFTFFEHLTANEEYVHSLIGIHKKDVRKLKTLLPLKKAFINVLEKYEISSMTMLPEMLANAKGKAKHEAMWAHFMFVFAFWIKDRSGNKEKTDALIEKSLRVAKDLEHSRLFESAMDLGKFIFKEIKSRA